MGKSWYGDVVEEVAPKAGAAAGGAIGGAIGSAIVPGAGTAVGAAIGSAVGGKLTSHGVKWLRARRGKRGDVVHAPGAKHVAMIHEREMTAHNDEADDVRRAMRDGLYN